MAGNQENLVIKQEDEKCRERSIDIYHKQQMKGKFCTYKRVRVCRILEVVCQKNGSGRQGFPLQEGLWYDDHTSGAEGYTL